MTTTADALTVPEMLEAAEVRMAAWLSPPPERRLPRDLNLPLSVFDPGALVAEPLEPMRSVRSLVHRPASCLHEERVDAGVRRAA